MKRALVIAAGLLILLAGLGWRQERELEALRSARNAGALGPVAFDLEPAEITMRPPKRARSQGTAEARRVAADFLNYAVEMDALGDEATRDPKGALRRRIAAQMDAVTSLDSRQLRVLVDEIAAAPGLEDPLRRTLLRWALGQLIEARPGDALAALTSEMYGLLSATNGVVENLVSDALVGLHRDDPTAALAWYRKNRDNLAPTVRDVSERRLIHAVAEADLQQALRLGDEWEMDQDTYLPGLAARAVQTPEQRLSSIAALREWRDDDPARHDEVFHESLGKLLLGRGNGSAGFDETLARMEHLELLPEEMELFVRRDVLDLSYYIKLDEAGRWAEWLVERFPDEVAADRARDLYTRWTRSDAEAAGLWLETAVESPAKSACVRAYADVMGRYQPQIARRWLEMLPPGPQRQESLERLNP